VRIADIFRRPQWEKEHAKRLFKLLRWRSPRNSPPALSNDRQKQRQPEVSATSTVTQSLAAAGQQGGFRDPRHLHGHRGGETARKALPGAAGEYRRDRCRDGWPSGLPQLRLPPRRDRAPDKCAACTMPGRTELGGEKVNDAPLQQRGQGDARPRLCTSQRRTTKGRRSPSAAFISIHVASYSSTTFTT
jgi:hypothetical protein